MKQDLARRIRFGRLFDIYGGLLTRKQQQCLKFYFYDDLSLAEIAEELDVSRQAVHDILKRSEQLLERHENRLELLLRENSEKKRLGLVLNLLETG
ncbi:MAG: DNA-binding protein, partial [Phascolarctobacterium sp.]|nr:DNA-binding protein [Phascolarctobacterium sp.]